VILYPKHVVAAMNAWDCGEDYEVKTMEELGG
jgi:hypothetical protein